MPNQYQQSAAAHDLLCVELNGQQTSPPLLTQALSVINNYGAATAGAPNFGSSSPGTGANGTNRGFPSTSSPGPTLELYNSSQDSVAGYVQATSPQPASAFPQIAVSRRRYRGSSRERLLSMDSCSEEYTKDEHNNRVAFIEQ